MTGRFRTLTFAAVGFLGLDGVLFLWLARAAHRPGFYWATGGCWAVMALVLLAAREQRRRLAAIAREREELRRAAEELRTLVRRP
ncbi:MAG TPA: hypothetical protein VFI39_03385 [Gemmatimonadales bacterium]|nr:hypothetical protein [Gemmatimonadales bacterium]